MVLHRSVVAPCTLADGHYRELLLDASPFLRREALAVRENIPFFHGSGADTRPVVRKRRLAVVVLAHGYCGAANKAIATLHAAWLDYGPSVERLRAFCGSVRSLATDFGPESLLANARHILPASYGRPVSQEDMATRLFPPALRLPGWSRALDTAMRHVASFGIPWYAAWSNQVKARGVFFRIASYDDILVASLKHRGRAEHESALRRYQTHSRNGVGGSLVRWCRAALDRREALRVR
jgi:hypothetical protein